MSNTEKKDALSRIADVLEAAQFEEGSLDLRIQMPDVFCEPVDIRLLIAGNTADTLVAELGSIAMALQAIAEAIKETKCS